jgi:hypothetical protein
MTADTPRQDGELNRPIFTDLGQKIWDSWRNSGDCEQHVNEVSRLIADATAKAYEAGQRDNKLQPPTPIGQFEVQKSNAADFERDKALAVVDARLNELEYVDPEAAVTIATGGQIFDSTVKERITELTAQKAKLEGENRE